jgi:hypothetical protein
MLTFDETTLKVSLKLQSPISVKNDSTRCSIEGEEEDVKSPSSSRDRIRLNLKRKIRFDSHDEELAAVCLVMMKKRARGDVLPSSQPSSHEKTRKILDHSQTTNDE